ncbi:lipopolysaccharide transport periplasmic protein LptA [Kaarinaea lacus]
MITASAADPQKPITIEADRAELDEKNEISIYFGNVVLQQGGITVKAEKLSVFAKKGELQQIKAEGTPLEFLQQREDKEDIRGSSQQLEYDAESQRFLLLNGAELWQGKNRFSGERIQFDAENEKVIATGNPDDPGKTSQRVQITIQPKSESRSQPESQPGQQEGNHQN